MIVDVLDKFNIHFGHDFFLRESQEVAVLHLVSQILSHLHVCHAWLRGHHLLVSTKLPR